jgi:hypothetical protein
MKIKICFMIREIDVRFVHVLFGLQMPNVDDISPSWYTHYHFILTSMINDLELFKQTTNFTESGFFYKISNY